METPRILFSSDIFTVTRALGFLHYLRFCICLFLPEVDDDTVEDQQSGRGMVAPNLRFTCAFVALKLYCR
ncbi:hypothetical protein KFK09_007281 [Dendrobium nobile]|uniref:Uncharacterized protein n=1 Tax=Dendrobium nobile TaxID=94219 RepID=A0A8T3BTN4_DENNO|nr:hypothetical protein KFK09_007281 [Dendrobium nobile]